MSKEEKVPQSPDKGYDLGWDCLTVILILAIIVIGVYMVLTDGYNSCLSSSYRSTHHYACKTITSSD